VVISVLVVAPTGPVQQAVPVETLEDVVAVSSPGIP
jgi:hypothetical protein